MKKASPKKSGSKSEGSISSKRQRCTVEVPNTDEPRHFFDGLAVHVFPTGIGSNRCKIFQAQIKKFGGLIHEEVRDSTTHLIVDESVTIQKICAILKWDTPPERIKIVKSVWVSKCIAEHVLLPEDEFQLVPKRLSPVCENKMDSNELKLALVMKNEQSTCPESNSLRVANQSESSTSDLAAEPTNSQSKFICSMPSSQMSQNHNKHITDQLEILSSVYKTTKDQWRSVGYEKAIIALKNYPKAIETWEEARSVRGVGERLADKIMEIVQTGHLRKIEETCSEKKVAALTLFQKIHGIGPNVAEAFVQQGFYTLEDLRTKAKLTKSQSIGLKYLDELQERMQRSEAFEIFSMVEKRVKSFSTKFIVEVCGSYRRNRPTCGDLDVLLTHPDRSLSNGILPRIVEDLHGIGLLTDDLVSQEENGSHKKYMGVCRLPGEGSKHRRIDIIAIPFDEYACALVHFTGSAYFNRSIRLLAHSKNMSLSEHSLRGGIVRKGREKVTDGYILPTPTEESIFEHLGLQFRPPDQRDHFAVE